MKKIKKIKKITRLLLLLLSISFVCIACKKEVKEDYDAKTYYQTKGEGYVFMCDSAGNILYPIQGAEISVKPLFNDDPNWWEIHPEIELYYSAVNGKYQISFLKRTKRCDVAMYNFYIRYYPENVSGGPVENFEINVDEVKNAQNNIIIFDTVKFDINRYRYK